MAIGVVILTGIDTLLQAGTKWRIHYRYNDLYVSATSELLSIPSTNDSKLDEFRLKLDALDTTYTKEALT
jgi:hypothetical protein